MPEPAARIDAHGGTGLDVPAHAHHGDRDWYTICTLGSATGSEEPMIVYTYRVTAVHEGYLAHCMETGVEAIGAQKREAIEELRKVLTEAATRDEAIAPPEETPPPPEVVLKEHQEPEPAPFGPGDSPAADDGATPMTHERDDR